MHIFSRGSKSKFTIKTFISRVLYYKSNYLSHFGCFMRNKSFVIDTNVLITNWQEKSLYKNTISITKPLFSIKNSRREAKK